MEGGKREINKQVNHFANMLKVCSLHLNLIQNVPITAHIIIIIGLFTYDLHTILSLSYSYQLYML